MAEAYESRGDVRTRFVPGRGWNSWPRELVMDYLQTVYMTMVLLQSCKKKCEMLRRAINMISDPDVPVAPQKPRSTAGNAFVWGFFLGVIPGIIWKFNAQTASEFLIPVVGLCCLTGFICYGVTKSREDNKFAKVMGAYNDFAALCEAQRQIAEQTRQTLREHLAAAEEEERQVSLKLKSLYAHNIIYPTFRTPSLVYMLWEYMDRKPEITIEQAHDLANEDRRFDRVISAMDSLKHAMVSCMASMYDLMNDLRLEVYHLGGQLIESNNAISRKLASLNQTMIAWRNASMAQRQQFQNESLSELRELNRTLDGMKYNQYLELIDRDRERYDRRR